MSAQILMVDMKILLVNDDGINGYGIRSLARVLSRSHSVTVVAPMRECSGTSHAITFFKALNYIPDYTIEGVKAAYSLDGTPVDCVKFGIDVICKGNEPDLIISGINNQLNLGTDVIYSGTVNAAFEGAIMDYKSIAVSTECDCDDFEFPSEFISNNLDRIIALIDKANTIININIPCNDRTKIKGVIVTELGIKRYNDRYELRKSTNHSGYYLIGNPVTVPENPIDCDVEMCNEGYITISPLTIQLTNFDTLTKTKKADFII